MKKLNIGDLSENVKNRAESDITENNIKNELTDHCIAQYTSYLNRISTENWKDHIEAKDKELDDLIEKN